jgi:hypothetical protein
MQQFVDNHFPPELGRLTQKVVVEGQPTLGGTTRPLSLHGPDMNCRWLDTDSPRPLLDLGLEDVRRHGFL